MCILSYLPAGVEVDQMALLNGGIFNPHGHGWAIAVDGQILIGKSMDVIEAIDQFVEAREKNPHGQALFHSRWATHGNTDVSNVHPFIVGGSHQTVMAHNGILDCTPNKSDPRSDTRLFADTLLPTLYRRFDRPSAFKALTKYAGPFNKLVILTVDPRYQRNAYIVNEDRGHWDKATGIWHSNHDYLGDGYDRWGATATPAAKTPESDYLPQTIGRSLAQIRADIEAELDERCDMCHGPFDHAGFCMDCSTCRDCYEPAKECQCWVHYRASLPDSYATKADAEYDTVH